jgi:hypothetical protein
MTVKSDMKSLYVQTAQDKLIMKVRQTIIVTCLIGLFSLFYMSGFLQKTFSQGEVAANMTAFRSVQPQNSSTLNSSSLNSSSLNSSSLNSSSLNSSTGISANQ